MDGTIAAARRALRIIWGDVPDGELVELTVRSRAGGRRGRGWRTVACPLAEAVGGGGGGEDGAAALRRASAGGADGYVGVCTLRKAPPEGRRGGAGLRVSAQSLWLDLDCVGPGREGERYFSGPEEAAAVVDRALDGLVPGLAARALLLSSGFGVQAFVPLQQRLTAGEASAAVRRLVAAVQEAAPAGRQIDRLWDSARLMRAPGTWNRKAGAGTDGAGEAPTGVLRWPADGAGPADWAVLDAALPEVAAQEAGAAAIGGGRLAGGAGVAGAGAGTGRRGPLMDIPTAADEELTWEEILVPAGWTRRETDGIAGWTGGGGELAVWGRPGRAGERSAVVYAGDPHLLTVFSSATGMDAALRRGAAGDGAAGAGVVSKWRALVALHWGGDREAAEAAVWSGDAASGSGSGSGRLMPAALVARMAQERDAAEELLGDWIELAERAVWGPGRIAAQAALNARKAEERVA